MKESINVWEQRRIAGNQMPREQLLAEIEDYIKKRANCSLATGYGTYIRNTPMRYSYVDGIFRFITEGGYKFKGLSANPHVCISIFDTGDLSSETSGLTIEGDAVVTEIPKDVNSGKSVTRYMIAVTPKLIDYLNSSLTARGYYKLQRVVFE